MSSRVEPIPWDPGWVRYYTGPKSWIIMTAEEAKERVDPERQNLPEIISYDPNKHDQERWEKVYGPIFEGCAKHGMAVPDKDFICNEELAHPVAEKEWPNYHAGHGRKGPRPFRSMSERREYQRRYGFGEA